MRVVLVFAVHFMVCACPTKMQEKKFPVGQIKTEFGEILVWFYDQTPVHKESFINLANQGYWDSLTFNRVIKILWPGGCPDTDKGFSGSPYLLVRVC